MTTRYLHHLFSDQDETVARYILRRRLEACSRALLSPSQRGRTVTAIAFDYGFNSPTHFGACSGQVRRHAARVPAREGRRRRLIAVPVRKVGKPRWRDVIVPPHDPIDSPHSAPCSCCPCLRTGPLISQPEVPDWAIPGSATHKQVPPPPDFHRATVHSQSR
jgi:AraC-like DNA-binding protein